MSPRPAAPSRASVTAWRTTSASECPANPRGCSTRTPPRTSGRPATRRCVSWPDPTRNTGAPFCLATLRRSVKSVDVERPAEGVVLVEHVLLVEAERDDPGRAVPLLLNQHLDLVVLGGAVVFARAVQEQHGVRILLDGT